MTGRGLLCVLIFAALGAAAAPVAGAVDATTPVTVGDRSFSAAELDAAALSAPGNTATQRRAAAAEHLIAAEWTAREAAARGIAVPDATIDAALAEDRRQAGGRYAETLASLDVTPEQRRADIALGIRRELVADAVIREAGPGPVAFGRAFDALAARERAVTACLPAYAAERSERCGNLPRPAERCTEMGLVDVCRLSLSDRRPWYVSPDLITAYLDPPHAALAATDPDGDRALTRTQRYLGARAPGARRR
ncbi:MAG TPA: hypothetical protein VNT55_20280, partial [Baekduia sp.]|nr:hypothetical protein [Baekduia sp.]